MRTLRGLVALELAVLYTIWHPIGLWFNGESDEQFYRRKYPDLYVREWKD